MYGVVGGTLVQAYCY